MSAERRDDGGAPRDPILTRRDAIRFGAVAVATLAARAALAQDFGGADSTKVHNGPTDGSTGSNLFAMNQGAARTVQRPPKPGVKPHVSNDERDQVEK